MEKDVTLTRLPDPDNNLIPNSSILVCITISNWAVLIINFTLVVE